MAVFIRILMKKMYADLSEDGAAITAPELAIVNRLLENNNVTIASVRAGNFGDYAKAVAEDFPYDETGRIN